MTSTPVKAGPSTSSTTSLFRPARTKYRSVGVLKLLGTYGTEYGVLSAAAFLTMAVPLLVFFSLQRFFVQGLLAGSVKS